MKTTLRSKLFVFSAFLLLFFLPAKAQYNTPTVDGAIGAGEYGTHTNGQNQETNGGVVTYMTWDATNLYVGVTGGNVAEGYVLYLDSDPQVPVNGGTNLNGTNLGYDNTGSGYDGTSFSSLPFRANIVVYLKNTYREYRTHNGANGWTGATSGFGSYSDNGTNIREVAIPWAAIGGIPASFNWFGYITSAGGFVYGQTPTVNAGGTIGTAARYERYYTVSTTTNGSATKPFSRESYVFNSTVSNNSFGAITVYDFTMNSTGLQIARLNSGGDWVINGNLVVNDGTIFFGSGGAGYGQTTVNNIDVRNVGSLNMDQTNKVLLVNGNISISSSSANALRLSSVAGGDLRLRGNFTKTNGTFTCNGRQVDFNGTTAQSITSNTALSINFLLVSNTTASVTSTNAAITVVNNLTINAGASCRLDMGTNTLDVGSASGNMVFGNLRSAGDILGASTGNFTFASGSQYEHNHSTTWGEVPTANWDVNSTCSIIGYTTNIFPPSISLAQAFGHFTWNCPGQTGTINLMGTLSSVAGNFIMVSTGSGQVDLANTSGEDYSLNIGGNFSQSGGTLVTQDLDPTFNTINITGNFSQTGGIFRGIGSGSFGTTDITVGGSFSQNGGTFDFGAGAGNMLFKVAGNFTQTSGTIDASTGTAGTYIIEWNGTVNQTITRAGTIPGTAEFSYRCNNAAGITLAAGTIIPVRDFMKFYRTLGAIGGTGTITYTNLAILEYDGTTAITTSDKEFPTSGFRGVYINNNAGVDLHAARTFIGPAQMQIINGQLRLGANDLKFDLTLGGNLTIVSPNSNKMVVTNGAGQLIYKISTHAYPAAAAGFNYRFHVGDNTGASEYTPIDFRFYKNTVAREIGVRVIDGISPNMNTPAAPADYLTRYWEITENGAGGTYRDSVTIHYDVATDVVGTQANYLVSDFNGATWNTFTTTVSSPRCTTSVATTEITLPLNGAHITGRSLTAGPTSYVWNGSTSNDWNTNTNWTPNGIPGALDDATIGVTVPNPCTVASGTVSVNNLTLNGTGVLNLSAATTLNIGGAFTYVGTATANFNCTSTVNITSASSQTVPAINYGNLNLVGGARTLANAGTIGICGNYTPSAGVTTTTGSTVNFNGTAAQAINTNAATFNNITVSNTAANVTSNVATAIAGIFTINSSARFDQAAGFILTLSPGSTTNVSGFLRNSSNNNIAGTGTKNFLAGGAYEHNFNGTLLSLPTATWNATSSCIIMGTPIGGTPGNIAQTFGNFTVNFTGTANISTSGNLTTINGNLSVLGTGTGSFRLTASSNPTVNVAGNLTVSGGTLDLSSGTGSTILNVAGSFSHTAGSITETGSGTSNLLQFNGTVNQSLNFGGTISNLIFYRFANAAGYTLTGTLTVNANSSLTLNQGTFSGAGVIGYNATGTTLIYDGNAAISSSNYEWPTVNRPLNITLNGGASLQVNLHAARGMTNGTLTLTLGVLNLGNFDLTIPTTATLTVAAPGSNKMIATGGTGFLVRGIPTGASSAFFPIGDITSGNEYSPTTLSFTANSVARNIGARVLDGNSPNLNTPTAATHYLSRYWLFSENAAGGTYSYTPAFTYNPGGDVNGTESQLKVANFVAGNWTNSTTTVSSPTITGTASLTQATANLNGAEFTGRETGTSYVWNGVTSTNWNTASNWTPNGNPGSLDDVTINVQVPNPCILPSGSVTVSSLTLNGTGDLQLAAGTSLTVTGSFTHGGSATASFDCSSTFVLSSAGAITIPAFNYGNLNISGGARTFANAGTIGICQTFTPGAGPFTNTGSTIDYNGTGAQTIAACSYNNLTISQARGANNITLVNGGTINVAGVFSPTMTFTSGIVDVTGNTFNFNGAAGQVMPAFWYNNITNTSNTTRTWANSGIIDIKGTFTPSTAVNTITGSTVRYSSTTTGFNLVNVNSNVASRSYNNLTFDGVGGGWTSGAVPLRITGNLTVTNGTLNIGNASAGVLIVDQTTTINGGTLNLTTGAGTGTATLTGAVVISSGTFNMSTASGAGTATMANTVLVSGGTLNLATTGDGTINLTGTGFSQTGGTISRTSGTASININRPGLVYTLSQTGGTMSGLFTILPVAATFTIATLTSDFNIGPNATFSVPNGGFLDCSTFVLSGNLLTIANGGRLVTANPNGITTAPTASGSVQTTTRTYGASCLFYYNGTVPQVTGSGLPATVDRLFVANTTAGGVTLTNAVTVSSEVNLGGLLFTANNNLNLGSACVFNSFPAGPLNASNMIVTNGTGKVFKNFSAAGSFTWPLGDNTGVTEYSPVTLNFSSMTVLPGSIGISVVNARHPQDATGSNYLNRYWSFGTTSLSTYTYTGTFTYTAADVVGSAALLKFNRWDNNTPAWHQDAGSTSIGNVLTTSAGLTQVVTSGLLNNVDVTGRVDIPMYFRTVATGDWSTPGTWEVSSDPAFLAPAPVPAGVAPNSGNSAGIQVRNTHNVTVTANVSVDDLVVDLGGTITNNSGITFTIANGVAATDMSVSGTLLNSGTVTSNGSSIFNATGIYEHNVNGGNIVTATWSAGSLCRVTGATGGQPGSLGQAFHHFEWNCPGQTGAVALVGALTTVNGNFTMAGSGTPTVRELRIFANASGGTLNIGGDLIITGGTFDLINSGSGGVGVGTVNVAGNVNISGGTLDMTGTATFIGGSSNLLVLGDFTVSGTGQVIRSQATPSTITFNKASGLQTFTATAAGTNLGTITWRVGNGVTAPTVALGSNIEIGSSAALNVLAGARLNCGTFYVQGNSGVGGSFTLAANGNLGIGSTDGISASPATTGNIRTLTARTFNTTSNYFYNGNANQITGTGLPATVANLTIENTGGGGNNIVTNTRAGATVVSNTFLLTSGEFFTGSANTITLSAAGSFTNNGGSLSTTGAGGQDGGTINFAGAGNINGSSSTTFYNVTINTGAVANTTMPFINGTLRINGGNLTAAPTYNAGSTLFYNVNYGRFVEWNHIGTGTLGVDPGFPNNVTVNSGTFDVYNGASGETRVCAGNLNIVLGATLNMGAMNAPLIVGGNVTVAGTLSLGAFGGDLEVKGDWTRTGTFNPNTRLVTFNGTSAQQLTGSTTFDYLQINNAAGLSLNNAVTVTSDLNLNVGIITIGNNNLVLGTATITNGGTGSYVLTNGTGILSRNVGAIARLYPVGTATSYAPATLTQNGTTENLNVRVGSTITNPVNDPNKMVNLQWNIGESVAGANNITSVFQWNLGDEAVSFNRALPVYQGHWTGSLYGLRTSTVAGSDPYTSSSTQNYVASLSNTPFVVGNLDGIVGCFATQANGDWNTPGTWIGSAVPPASAKICISHAVTINTVDPSSVSEISLSGAGSLNISALRTLNIENGGFLDNSGGTSSTGSGTIVFLGAGSIQGSTASTIQSLILNGGTTLTTIPTINGNLQLNSGSFVTAPPVYGISSTLIYNTGGAYGVSNEWTGSGIVAGSGTPNNVIIQNSTSLTMPNSNRGMAGNLTIASGGLVLNATSGDLSLGGTWTRTPPATFTDNNRAVFFRGANPQTITVTGGGTESFAYLGIDKTASDVILNSTPATSINITGNAGDVLQLINTGGLDLNGQTLNLNNAGGAISTNGARNIIGGAGSLVAVNASKSVNASLGGTLTFGSNVMVNLNAGMDFGNTVSTINGTLRISNGGFVNTNPPSYGVSSVLQYFSGTNYGRGQEWSATSGPGYPYNVAIDFNGTPTTLDMSINGNAYREMAGNLFINDGGTLNMNAMTNVLQVLGDVTIGSGTSGTLTLGIAAGGDIAIAGDLTRNSGATFTQNGREVTMNGPGNIQNISSNISSFDYLKIDNNGGSVVINNNTVINNRLWLNQGLLNNSVNTITLSNNAQLRRSIISATMVNSPLVAGADVYDLRYDASMISLNEWNTCATCVRDVSITAGTLTLGGSRSLNRHLNLAGDLDLAGFTLTLRGRNVVPATAGNIEVTGGNRLITGTAGSIFDIVGLGANTPAEYTKTVTTIGLSTLTFDSNVLVRIGDGRMDWGTGNPTTINGVLQVMLGGSVFPNSCYYGVGSTLRFANTVDYGIPATDKTWASGAIYSGLPGIPYHVDVNDVGTDLQLFDARALRGNLTITNGTFTLMPAYVGNFSIGGNWSRSGASSAYVHNNKKVVFDGANSQSITCTASGNIETFYDLDISPSGGFDVTLGGATDLIVLNELTLTSGKLDLSGNEITLGSTGNNGVLTGGGSSNYVVSGSSTAKFNRFTTTTGTTYNFPLGDATGYTPIAINLYTGSSVNANSMLSAYLIAGSHPNLGTSTNFINRYWSVEPTSYGANAYYGVTYTYKDADVSGIEATLRPFKYNPSGWIAATGSGADFEMGSGNVDPVLNTVSWSGLYTFSDYTANGNGSPLPITLIEFTATPLLDNVELNWTTAIEINNDYFTIERSSDGKKFELIQVVDGAGNSNDWLYYKWVDRSPLKGISYYRLKQTDFDGTSSYSDIRMVNFNGRSEQNGEGFSVYPNPAPDGVFNLWIGETNAEEINLSLTNLLGEVVMQKQYTVSSNQTLSIATENLAKGVYTLSINDGNKIFSQRIILGKE